MKPTWIQVLLSRICGGVDNNTQVLRMVGVEGGSCTSGRQASLRCKCYSTVVEQWRMEAALKLHAVQVLVNCGCIIPVRCVCFAPAPIVSAPLISYFSVHRQAICIMASTLQ